jgi:hypothetical protein
MLRVVTKARAVTIRSDMVFPFGIAQQPKRSPPHPDDCNPGAILSLGAISVIVATRHGLALGTYRGGYLKMNAYDRSGSKRQILKMRISFPVYFQKQTRRTMPGIL